MREYWLVNPELDSIKVSRRHQDGSFRRVAELTSDDGDTLTEGGPYDSIRSRA